MIKKFLFRCVAILPANVAINDSILAIFSIPISVWFIAIIKVFFNFSKSNLYVVVGMVFVFVHFMLIFIVNKLENKYLTEINNYRSEKERINNNIIVCFVFLIIFLTGVLYFNK